MWHSMRAFFSPQAAWLKAAAEGDLAKLQILKSQVSIATIDEQGYTALHLASNHNHQPVVAWLCQQPSVPLTAANLAGKTALELAAAHGHQAIVVTLLTSLTAIPTDALTPILHDALNAACHAQQATVVAELLPHIGSLTPAYFYELAYCTSADILRQLFQHITHLADTADAETSSQSSTASSSIPVYHSAWLPYLLYQPAPSAAPSLLQRSTTATRTALQIYYNDALDVATRANDTDTLNALAHAGTFEALTADFGDNHTHPVTFLAIEQRRLTLLKALVAHGASLAERDQRTQETTVHHAAAQNDVDSLRWLIEEQHCAADAADTLYGNTPYLLAVREGSQEAAEYLAKRPDVNVKATNLDGASALMQAVDTLRVNTITWLMARQEGVTWLDNNGYNLVHHLAYPRARLCEVSDYARIIDSVLTAVQDTDASLITAAPKRYPHNTPMTLAIRQNNAVLIAKLLPFYPWNTSLPLAQTYLAELTRETCAALAYYLSEGAYGVPPNTEWAHWFYEAWLTLQHQQLSADMHALYALLSDNRRSEARAQLEALVLPAASADQLNQTQQLYYALYYQAHALLTDEDTQAQAFMQKALTYVQDNPVGYAECYYQQGLMWRKRAEQVRAKEAFEHAMIGQVPHPLAATALKALQPKPASSTTPTTDWITRAVNALEYYLTTQANDGLMRAWLTKYQTKRETLWPHLVKLELLHRLAIQSTISTALLDALIDWGYKVTDVNHDGDTVWHVVLDQKSLAQTTLKWLLKFHAASINHPNRAGATPLMLALHHHPQHAKTLLQAGADPFLCDSQGNHAVFYALRSLDSERSLTALKRQLTPKQLTNIVNQANHKGRVPLHEAVHHKAATQWLCEQGGALLDGTQWDQQRQSPLHVAASAGCEETLTYLMAREKTLKNAWSKFSNAMKRQQPLVVHLAPFLGPLGKDVEGYTPLMRAVQHGHVTVVKRLTEHESVQVNQEVDPLGHSLVALAVQGQYQTLVAWLCQTYATALRDFPNQQGKTALMLAQETQQDAIAKTLIQWRLAQAVAFTQTVFRSRCRLAKFGKLEKGATKHAMARKAIKEALAQRVADILLHDAAFQQLIEQRETLFSGDADNVTEAYVLPYALAEQLYRCSQTNKSYFIDTSSLNWTIIDPQIRQGIIDGIKELKELTQVPVASTTTAALTPNAHLFMNTVWDLLDASYYYNRALVEKVHVLPEAEPNLVMEGAKALVPSVVGGVVGSLASFAVPELFSDGMNVSGLTGNVISLLIPFVENWFHQFEQKRVIAQSRKLTSAFEVDKGRYDKLHMHTVIQQLGQRYQAALERLTSDGVRQLAVCVHLRIIKHLAVEGDLYDNDANNRILRTFQHIYRDIQESYSKKPTKQQARVPFGERCLRATYKPVPGKQARACQRTKLHCLDGALWTAGDVLDNSGVQVLVGPNEWHVYQGAAMASVGCRIGDDAEIAYLNLTKPTMHSQASVAKFMLLPPPSSSARMSTGSPRTPTFGQ